MGWPPPGGVGEGGRDPYKITWGCLSYLSGIKKAVLVLLRASQIKTFTKGAFLIPLNLFSQRKIFVYISLVFFVISLTYFKQDRDL